MNKEIIIDGVNVVECNFLLEREGKQKCESSHATGFGVICDCDKWHNCYYKQLKRLEQENAELKAENDKLKEENYQLQKGCQICENFIDFIPCKPIRDMDYDLQKVINQRDKYYKQTLDDEIQINELMQENERLKEEIKYLEEEKKEKIQLLEQIINILYPNANDDELFTVTFNGEYIDKLKKIHQTLQKIKTIAEAPKPFIDFSVIKTATEVGYDYAVICNELELRLHKVLELITKTEE